MTQTPNTKEATSMMTAIQRVRRHHAASRTMQRGLRLRLYQGRNGGGMTYLWHDKDAEAMLAQMEADEGGRSELASLLRSEHDLALRVSENRDLGNDRPELKARLAAVRRAANALEVK
jgi:hypothetical protein